MHSNVIVFLGMVCNVKSVLRRLRQDLKGERVGRRGRGMSGMTTETMMVWEMVMAGTTSNRRKESRK